MQTWEDPSEAVQRARRSPVRGPAAANQVDPADLVALQRTVGNGATGRLLRAGRSPFGLAEPPAATPRVARARAVGPRGTSARLTVQRDEESAALLAKLAVPTIRDGPAIAVQKKLIENLETLLGEEAASEINLGGILLDRLPDCYEGNDDLYEKASAGAKLVPLPSTIPKESFRSAGADRAAQVIGAGLGPAVVENTLKTMIDAKQLEYLRLAKIPNADWKILVEVHYIRSRPKDMAGFHKDTRGESLFVNLNYHVGDNKVVAPEHVINPTPSAKHDEQIFGTNGKAGTLPKAFTDDLNVLRGTLGEPTEIRTGIVNPYGYVAFVDEAIHHATPYYGHRFVTGKEFKDYLARSTYKDKFNEMDRAIKKFKGSIWSEKIYPFDSYVNKSIVPADELDDWKTLMAMVGDDKLDTKYTREELVPAILEEDEFELMLDDVGAQEGAPREKAGSGGWYSANIPGAGLSPLKAKNRPPLKRRGSTADFKRDRPKQLPDDTPRRFLRTWVRVIPETKAAKLRTWAKDNRWT